VRPGPPGWALLSLLLLPALSSTARAEVFLSPGLEARTGYTSNRFLEPEEEGSAFTLLTPSLEANLFLPGGSEVLARLSFRRTDYLKTDFGHVQQAQADVTATAPFGALTGSLRVSAGGYWDQGLPEDDSRWVALSPGFSWLATPQFSLSLAGSITATRYDSRETLDGDPQSDTRGEVRPGVLWAPNADTQLWGELYGEVNRSNEPTEEYDGGGLGAGIDITFLGAARAGAWARYGTRAYRESSESSGDDRRDTPFSVGAWGALRLAPWAELTAGATRVDYRSTDDDQDYTAWTVEGGLRFVYDWEVAGK